ncbi:Metallo-dependent phosphatase-like protein [Mycena maculata]|uniref:Metallo-dependent phosphatase-like protein n=1 Tax=Mycena maculata TaxID=230809 RepID=A0AAD7HF62_9AGAR|nr:Metallo-dependent phosphatase-like protein [Mycena maculata]
MRRTLIRSRTSVVQLEYPPEEGPRPKPQESSDAHWTRFVLISDTHTSTFPVPDGDVLLHTGDLTQMGTLKELETTMEWLYALPHQVKIVIAGNHDYALDHEWYAENWRELPFHRKEPESAEPIREFLKGPRAVRANVVYLQSEGHKFRVREGGQEWTVYGSPHTPTRGGWGFGYKPENGEALVSQFPKTDILLTHGPPRDVFDYTNRSDSAGCPALSRRVMELKPKLHAFGHIHEARGAYIHFWRPDSSPPSAQNEPQAEDVKDTFWTKIKLFKAKKALERFGISTAVPGTVVDEPFEQTVFVNGANWPAGQRAWNNGRRVKIGAVGFQPIVVDLMEA